MHAGITISNLSCRNTDGKDLFQNINLTLGPELTGLIGRNGSGKTTLLKIIAGEQVPASGTVAVAGPIGVFRQTVQPYDGLILSDLFGLTEMLRAIEVAEKGLADSDMLAQIDWLAEEKARKVLAQHGLSKALDTPLHRLSGGELTRARLAAVRYRAPDFILMDEPTNSLDAEGRQDLLIFLRNWNKAALVVSHDRALLDEMNAIVELSGQGAKRYGGNFEAFEKQKMLETEAAMKAVNEAENEMQRVKRVVRERSERKSRADSNGKRLRKRGGMPKIVLDGMKENAEGSAGRQNTLSTRQVEEASANLARVKEQFDIVQPLSVELPTCGLRSSQPVLSAEKLSIGYDGNAPLISDLDFEMIGPERVAVSGANGTGKTTLLNSLTGEAEPLAGRAQIFVPYGILDQTVSALDHSATVRDNFRRLNPGDDDNACRSALARFRFRAESALRQVSSLSGGEILRAGLAVALGGTRPAQLLILDEPTNHLDLESITNLEEGLRDYDGAVLVVSHNETFLKRIGVSRSVMIGSHRR